MFSFKKKIKREISLIPRVGLYYKSIMDPNESEIINIFFSDESLLASICALCQINKHSQDPVSQTIVTILNCPVHIQLTQVGLQPFQGRELTFPYHMMTSSQRRCIQTILTGNPSKWNVYEHAMVYKRSGTPVFLKPIDVLTKVCTMILSSRSYEDKRLRVAICNIILQRVQASIPMDRNLQAQLNERVFSCK